MTKKLIVGQAEWGIADADAQAVAGSVREAMTHHTSVELPLADAAGRAVTVFLNGAVAPCVVLELDGGPRRPGGKKLIVGQAEWGIADADAQAVAGSVREAMTHHTSVELPLADAAGRAVTVFLNGSIAPCVVLDLDGGPRPSEMS